MKKRRPTALDFEIDRLTNSIENTISGDSFQTEVSFLTVNDLKTVIKKNGWLFNWKEEFADNTKETFKLTIVNSPSVIQGLLSLTIETDHVFMNLVENSPFNIGKAKLYEGVAGNLIAYACKVSFQKGFEGFVAFDAKTKLIQHYQKTLGAYHFNRQRMIIPPASAQILIEKYFKS